MKINILIVFLVLLNFSAYSQDCNSLLKNGENYAAGDNEFRGVILKHKQIT